MSILRRGRLAELFAARAQEKRLVLIFYITCGYPMPEETVRVCRALVEAGADAIELGVPFSDPLADGPTIQHSSALALQQGMSVRRCVELAGRVRFEVGEAPALLFMTYWNPILQYGFERFVRDASGVGVDGLILPDVPLDELMSLAEVASSCGLDVVPLVAPNTSPERAKLAAKVEPPFIYLTSRLGVTGARQELPTSLKAVLCALRSVVNVPIAVGFGIAKREHLLALKGYAEGAVVGSALLDRLAKGVEPAAEAAAFCRELLGPH